MSLPVLSDAMLFAVLVFVAAVLLSLSLTTPTLGSEAKSLKRTRERVRSLMGSMTPEATSLLLKREQQTLSPIALAMQKLPQLDGLATMLRQLGSKTPAFAVVLGCVGLGVASFLLLLFLRAPIIPLLAIPFAVAYLPIFVIKWRRDKRIDKFEEQLPEALAMMARAMRAGLPFAEALRSVAQEMPAPLGSEFSTVFADINYGLGVKDGLLSLLTRMPSLSLQTMVTAVLVQRETGGNLAEILEKIAVVIRSREKLFRKVKSLSAEGRMSGWVLVMIPLILGLTLAVTSPTYMPMLLGDPLGQKLLWTMFGLLGVGVIWIRKIINIQV